MFGKFGKISQMQFVKADIGSESYGWVQFENAKDCQRAWETYKEFEFSDHTKLKLSIMQRRASSLSEEPTNLYVRNLPKFWGEDHLRKLFQNYGKILQCRIISDGIAFVRLDDHYQATTVLLLLLLIIIIIYYYIVDFVLSIHISNFFYFLVFRQLMRCMELPLME
ncbi:hypothetical protein RFI_14826, partial [Reticulomyxa filosa]